MNKPNYFDCVKALRRIVDELKGIAPDDLTKAETNILKIANEVLKPVKR